MSFLFHRHKHDSKSPDSSSSSPSSPSPVAVASAASSGLKQIYKTNGKQSKKTVNEKASKRIWESQNSPGEVLDLSECNLSELPSETYVTCDTFQKVVLLAHSNVLVKLDASIGLLTRLQILDLHNNQLESLPAEISQMKGLKSLDLSFNKLKKLPDEIGGLSALYALRLRGNQLTKLPSQLCKLHLLTLDLRDNALVELPHDMYQVTTLQEFNLVGNSQLTFPSASVIQGGTATIMHALCAAKNTVYVPASSTHLSENPQNGFVKEYTNLKAKQIEDEALIERYMKSKQAETEKLQRQHMEKEKLFEEHVRQQRALDDHLKELRSQQYANELALGEKHSESLTNELLKRQAENQRRLVAEILSNQNKEAAAMSDLVSRLEQDRIGIAIQEQLRKDKILLEEEISRSKDAFEKQRLREMQEALKEREIAENKMQEARLQYETQKAEAAKRTQQMYRDSQKFIDATLVAKDAQYDALIKFIKSEEDKYQSSFEKWQMEKDEKFLAIYESIQMVEADLARLAAVARAHSAEKSDAEADLLSQEQQRLYHKLCILIEQQKQRENEIRNMIQNLDEEYKQQQRDLWQHEFAQLLSRRPNNAALPIFTATKTGTTGSPHPCDAAVAKKLESLHLSHLIPIFARERIDETAWLHLSDIHLQAIGVTALGDRLKIMSTVPL